MRWKCRSRSEKYILFVWIWPNYITICSIGLLY